MGFMLNGEELGALRVSGVSRVITANLEKTLPYLAEGTTGWHEVKKTLNAMEYLTKRIQEAEAVSEINARDGEKCSGYVVTASHFVIQNDPDVPVGVIELRGAFLTATVKE